MADLIKIILPSDDAGKSPVAKSSSEQSAPSSSGGGNDGAITAKQVVSGAKKILAMTGIKQIADSVISYEISSVSLRTGASEYQQKVQFAYSEGMQAASSVGAIAMGAIMGGPAGAAIAAAGVGLSYVMKFIGWAQNENTIQIEQNREDVSIVMQNIRAGALGRRNGS